MYLKCHAHINFNLIDNLYHRTFVRSFIRLNLYSTSTCISRAFHIYFPFESRTDIRRSSAMCASVRKDILKNCSVKIAKQPHGINELTWLIFSTTNTPSSSFWTTFIATLLYLFWCEGSFKPFGISTGVECFSRFSNHLLFMCICLSLLFSSLFLSLFNIYSFIE